MYKGKMIGVVVPAYNEEKLIGRVVETMPGYIDKIIIVDDCSQDRTNDIAAQYREAQPEQVVLLQHSTNRGVGGAISTGYIWCRDNGIDIAVVMAGDAQMDPQDLDNLLDPVAEDEADYTKGNRLFTGEAWKIIPRWRYLGNSALSLLTKIASGYWHVADSQSGYTAINSKALKLINWQAMYPRYGQPNDLLVRLNVYNLRVKDVPIQPVYNIGEKSGIKPLAVIPRLSFLLTKMFLWRMYHKYIIRDFHPLVFFYLLSFGLIFLTVLFFIRMVWIWTATGNAPPINTMVFIFTGITGIQSLFFAMWFDMDYNKRLK